MSGPPEYKPAPDYDDWITIREALDYIRKLMDHRVEMANVYYWMHNGRRGVQFKYEKREGKPARTRRRWVREFIDTSGLRAT